MIRCGAIFLAAILLQGGASAASELSEHKFQQLHAEVQQDTSAPWRTIPWQTSLTAAQGMAVERKLPLFIWAMDGHPLGCT